MEVEKPDFEYADVPVSRCAYACAIGMIASKGNKDKFFGYFLTDRVKSVLSYNNVTVEEFKKMVALEILKIKGE